MNWDGVYVILPTLNEEEGLSHVLLELKKMKFPMRQVVVVDGHSTDNTLEVAKTYGVNIILQRGTGKGMAFQTFMEEFPVKDENIYVMLDADYSYNPKEVVKFVSTIREGYDVVAGRRKFFIGDARSFLHIFGNLAISFVSAILTRRIFLDICTGYWAFKGSALKRMRIKARGFELEANLFIETARKNLKFRSIPVDYRERKGKRKLKSLDGFKILIFLLKECLQGKEGLRTA